MYQSIKSVWLKYWFTPLRSSRQSVLHKAVLVLLMFDAWIVMPEHGGRYGTNGFNVAHFAWLDFVSPWVTPELYIITALGVGMLCFALLWVPDNLALRVALFATYTFAWACSMLDSYQHHYFISLLLFCFIFWPTRATAHQAYAYHMVSFTIAVVYFYTGITKLSPQWLSGESLQWLTRETWRDADLLRTWLRPADSSSSWRWLGMSVPILQFTIALGYAAAPWLHHARRSWRHVISLTLIPALMFHIGAELLRLRIAWFSYYMIVIALVYFLPAMPHPRWNLPRLRITQQLSQVSSALLTGLLIAAAK